MKLLLKASLMVIVLPLWAETIPLSRFPDSPSSTTVETIKSRGQTLHHIKFNLSKLEARPHPEHSQFKVLSEKNISFSQTVGESQLPFKSVIIAGAPKDIEVTLDPRDSFEFPIISAPAQPEDCRCESALKKSWVPLKKSSNSPLYKIESLGKLRGQELSRVTFYAAKLKNNSTLFYPRLEAQVRSNYNVTALNKTDYDYLIVTPESLLSGLTNFVQYKINTGLKVKVITLEEVGKSVSAISNFFKTEYEAAHYKYALIVGTDNLFPNHIVDTSGSSRTPSDYPYFLMDQNDLIPDVHYGRVVASTPEEVERQTKKWMNENDFNQRT